MSQKKKSQENDVKNCLLFLLLGGIFPKNEDGLVNAFQKGARLQNREREYVKIYTNVTKVDTNDSFEVQKAGSVLMK